jgi:CRISPR-associated protein Cas2
VARRRYLIAYDIAEPRRLRRICSIMESFGERLQYSVFLCDLSVPELLALEDRVLGVMNRAEDSVVQIDLGQVGSSAPVRFLGRRRPLPDTGPQIV